MERAFDTGYISELLDSLNEIIDNVQDGTENMKTAADKASSAVNEVPADVKMPSVYGDASSLRGSMREIDYTSFKGKVEDCEERALQLIPQADADFGSQLEALVGALQGLKGALDSMNVFLGTTSLALPDDAFELAYNQFRGDITSAIEKAKSVADKVHSNVKGAGKQSAEYSKDPVNLATGNFIYDKNDLEIGGAIPFIFRRFYNAINQRAGVLGSDWNHNYEVAIYREDERYVLIREDGKEEIFIQTSDGQMISLLHSSGTLTSAPDGYRYELRDKTTYFFDKNGRYEKCESDGGIVTTLEYGGEEGRLSRVIRSTGEYFALSYDAEGHLSQVKDHAGRAVRYKVSEGILREVENAAGGTTRYEYSRGGKISAVTNAAGIVSVTNFFDEQNRTTLQMFPDGTSMSYEYDDEKREVTLTERNGSKVTYVHDDLYRDIRHIYPDGEERFEYNKLNQKTLVVDKLGNKTQFAYDSRGNLTRVIDALGTKTEIQYNEANRPTCVFVNGEEKERYRYDDEGNLIERKDALGYSYKMEYQRKRMPEKISQPDGSVVKLEYDGRGNVSSIEDVEGNRTTFVYDALNRVAAATDANGNATAYEYDVRGNITKVANANGDVRRYAYNASGKVTEITDFDGSKVKREYNALNKVSKVVDPLGRETLLSYDAMWNVASVTVPNGGVTSYAYDEFNRLGQVTNANGGSVVYAYDAAGHRTSVRDEEGNTTRFSYDAVGRLVAVTEPDGLTYRYSYDADGHLVRVENTSGNTVTMKYNKNGWLLEEANEAGERRVYSYTNVGDVETITDESGLVTRFCYAPGGRLTEKHFPDGCEERYEYDAVGNLEFATDRWGYQCRFRYDCLNQLVSVEGSDGASRQYEYDPVGNMTAIVDALGNRTEYEYSLTGKLTGVVDALGNRTEYAYDLIDQLVEIRRYGEFVGVGSESHCQITRYERDLLGWVTKVVDPLGQGETYSYDKKGQLVQKVDKEGYLTKYGYTEKGDIANIQYADGRAVRLSYNPLRQLQEVEDWLGVTQITTDSRGRALKVATPDGKEVRYSYNEMGRRASLTYPDGRVASYEYDGYGRLASLTSEGRTITYSYDGQGFLSEKNFPNGISTRYGFDEKGRITHIIHEDSEGVLDSYAYSYDLLGNKIRIEKYRRGLQEDSGIFAYGYDSLGRLVSAAKDGAELRRYDYDAFGNRTALVEDGHVTRYAYNALNQLVSKVDTEIVSDYRYDKRGNLSAILENGLLKNEYVYGAINRLEEARSGEGEIARYLYNGLGKRVGKEVGRVMGLDARNVKNGSVMYDMGYVVGEAAVVGVQTSGYSSVSATSGDQEGGIARGVFPMNSEEIMRDLDPIRKLEKSSFVPTSRIDYVIDLTKEYHNLLQKSGDGSNQIYFWDGNVAGLLDDSGFNAYLLDDLGSPVRFMGGDGELLDSYGYDEFGRDTYGNQGLMQPFGFTGYQYDCIANTYYAQAREYVSDTARFIERDIIKGHQNSPKTFNEYSYVLGNPFRYVDLNGKEYVGVVYLNVQSGAIGQGHAAILLIDGNGEGDLYSFVGDDSDLISAVSTDPNSYNDANVDYAHYDRDALDRIFSAENYHVDIDTASTGKMRVDFSFPAAGNYVFPDENKAGLEIGDDYYNRGIFIPIDNEQGNLIESAVQKTMAGVNKSVGSGDYSYNLWGNGNNDKAYNCDQMAREWLSTAGIIIDDRVEWPNMAIIISDDRVGDIRGPGQQFANDDYWAVNIGLALTLVRPNSVYNYAASKSAENGWSAGFLADLWKGPIADRINSSNPCNE